MCYQNARHRAFTMKFKTIAQPMPLSAVAPSFLPHRRTGMGRRCWSLGAALLIGLGGYGCGRSGNSSTEATPTPTPTPTPSPAGTPVVVTTPTPTPEPTVEAARYSGKQQAEYIQTAQNAFMEARSVKLTPFLEANKAFQEAGGASAKGLTSKEAVTQRRALIEACRKTNEDYLTFASTQPDTYRAELAKTPLIPSDVDGLVAGFTENGRQQEIIKLRTTERESLKTADDMMAYLEKTYGSWTLSGNLPKFKKPADINAYGALGRKYNGLVADVQKLQAVANAPLPTPGETPIPSASPSSGTTVGAQPTAPAPAVASPSR